MCIIGARATFDFSNMDLVNFKYFKYPKTTSKPIFVHHNGQVISIRKVHDPPTMLEDTFNRAQAVVMYLKGVMLGNSKEKLKTLHILDPEFGQKRSRIFQKKYGKFGEKLVELLGSGSSSNNLIESGATDH